VPAAVDDEISALAVPGKRAPGLDDLSRRGLSRADPAAELLGRPRGREVVLVDLYPLAFGDAFQLVDQKGQIRAGRLRIKKVGARTIITPEAEAEWLDSLPEKVGPPRGIALKKMTA